MPEGDTLARIADVLGRALSGQTVTGARGRPGGARLDKVVGATVVNVESRGKHLLVSFSNGMTLHTHLAMTGEWHRYRPTERWHQPADRAVAVIETAQATAVAFNAPTVELIDTRALALHPRLSKLGSDLSKQEFDPAAAVDALRDPSRVDATIGDALLDQRALAGLGNVYRSELCFIERLNPFTPVRDIRDATLHRLVNRGAKLVKQNSQGGARVTTSAGTPTRTYVYGRTGRPCLRCGTQIRSEVVRSASYSATPRRVYWCPSCQRHRDDGNAG
jgi:endonuclease VIII